MNRLFRFVRRWWPRYRGRKVYALISIVHADDLAIWKIPGASGPAGLPTVEQFLRRIFDGSKSIPLAGLLEDLHDARVAPLCLIPSGKEVDTPTAAARFAWDHARCCLWPWEAWGTQLLVLERPEAGLLAFVVKVGRFPREQLAAAKASQTRVDGNVVHILEDRSRLVPGSFPSSVRKTPKKVDSGIPTESWL